jgi:hypothetical protein
MQCLFLYVFRFFPGNMQNHAIFIPNMQDSFPKEDYFLNKFSVSKTSHYPNEINQTQARSYKLGAVYTRVFCVRCPVRDGAAAQQLPLHFSRDHVREKAKKAVG